MAEQWVKLLSHWKGCEVFQNVGCTGKTDLVLVHPILGTLEVDVKCTLRYKGVYQRQGSRVKDPDVFAVEVTPEGDVANWKVSWSKARIPEGWENFWANDYRIYTTNPTKPTE